jgi:hypothetical protein
VHGTGGAKQHALVRAQVTLAEEAAHPRHRRVRDRAALAHDRSVEALNKTGARTLARAARNVAVRDRRRFECIRDEEIDELDDLLLTSSV